MTLILKLQWSVRISGNSTNMLALQRIPRRWRCPALCTARLEQPSLSCFTNLCFKSLLKITFEVSYIFEANEGEVLRWQFLPRRQNNKADYSYWESEESSGMAYYPPGPWRISRKACMKVGAACAWWENYYWYFNTPLDTSTTLPWDSRLHQQHSFNETIVTFIILMTSNQVTCVTPYELYLICADFRGHNKNIPNLSYSNMKYIMSWNPRSDVCFINDCVIAQNISKEL